MKNLEGTAGNGFASRMEKEKAGIQPSL